MARPNRVSPDNSVQHILNRGNRRATLFHQQADYEAFTDLLAEAAEQVPMRLLAFCLMPNHWHLVVWAIDGIELSAYMQWLTTAHVLHYQHTYSARGLGHVYQARFRNFLIQEDDYFYQASRYVEANAKSAGLVVRAEDWEWSSIARQRSSDGRPLLSPGPLPRPTNWSEYVNRGIPADELRRLRMSARRGAPYGSDGWVERTAAMYGLESTIAKRGRPSRQDDSGPSDE